MADTKAKKRGTKWQGQYRYGGYWFPVKRRGVATTFVTAEAARRAAAKAAPAVRT